MKYFTYSNIYIYIYTFTMNSSHMFLPIHGACGFCLKFGSLDVCTGAVFATDLVLFSGKLALRTQITMK